MDFKEENIDRLFREGLKNFEVAPPSEVWEGVKQARIYKKKRILPIFRYAAAAYLKIGKVLFFSFARVCFTASHTSEGGITSKFFSPSLNILSIFSPL